MIDYKFYTLKELVEELNKENRVVGTPVGFTLDKPEDVFGEDWEPTGWYGVMITNDFDGRSMLYGNYGIGVVYSDCLNDITEMESLIGFLKSETNVDYTENDYVCVDAADLIGGD